MNTTAETSSPQPRPSTGPKRLRRSTHGSVAGVAKGLADYIGIETKWVRLAFLVSLLFGGGGFFLYLAAWLAIPDESDPRTDHVILTQNLTRLIAAGVFAVFAFGAVSGAATLSAGLLIPAVLVGGGIYLLVQNNDSSDRLGGQHPKAESSAGADGLVGPPPPPPPPAEAPESSAEPDDDRDPLLIEAEKLMSGEAYLDADPLTPPVEEPAHWALTKAESDVVVRSRRRRPPILTMALGTGLLVSALLLLTSTPVGVAGHAAVFVVVAMVGFVASLFYRRPAWALVPIVLIGGAIAVTALAVGSSIDAGVGESIYTATGEANEITDFELGVGRLAVDFDQITLTEDRRYSIELAIGQIDLDLPSAYPVELVLPEGALVDFGDDEQNFVQGGTVVLFEPTTGASDDSAALQVPTLRVVAEVRVGVISVDRPSQGVVYTSAD